MVVLTHRFSVSRFIFDLLTIRTTWAPNKLDHLQLLAVTAFVSAALIGFVRDCPNKHCPGTLTKLFQSWLRCVCKTCVSHGGLHWSVSCMCTQTWILFSWSIWINHIKKLQISQVRFQWAFLGKTFMYLWKYVIQYDTKQYDAMVYNTMGNMKLYRMFYIRNFVPKRRNNTIHSL